MNNIVVLGKGYLGSEFANKGFDSLGRDAFYFRENLSSDEYMRLMNSVLLKYDVIINCLAKSNTRYCEENFDDALLVNATIPYYLSHWCKQNNKRYVHISTGCLYDKNNIPQKETDFLAAHCNYTLTKWMAEKACSPEDLIIRPRLFFDESSRPNNLLRKLQFFTHHARELDSVSSTHVVVEAVTALINAKRSGIFNVACDGFISMQEIGNIIGHSKDSISIEQIRMQQGLYLVNNVMDLSKLKKFYNPPNIRDEIERCWKLGKG